MKFGYTIVYVPSVADTLAFYEKAFGFQVRFLNESGQYGELESGSTTLAFASHAMGGMNFGANFVPVSANVTPPGIELAFITDDVSSAYAKAIAAGALPLLAPVQKPWGQMVAMFVHWKERSLSCARPLVAKQPLGMNEFLRLAAKIDQHMQQLAAQGVSEAHAIINRMMGYVSDLHKIWVGNRCAHRAQNPRCWNM
jgi:uncharacterized glyoxalase superfamily protein PhnB